MRPIRDITPTGTAISCWPAPPSSFRNYQNVRVGDAWTHVTLRLANRRDHFGFAIELYPTKYIAVQSERLSMRSQRAFTLVSARSVARRNLYLDRIQDTQTIEEVSAAIERFRETLPTTRPWKNIPC